MLWCLPSPRQSPNDRRWVFFPRREEMGIRGIGSQEWWGLGASWLSVSKKVVWCMYSISWAFFFEYETVSANLLKSLLHLLVRFVGCFFADSCFYNMFFWVWMDKNGQVRNSWSACSRILIHPEPKRRKWERCNGPSWLSPQFKGGDSTRFTDRPME